MSDDTVSFDKRALDKFLKSLKGRLPSVQVGILGDKDARTGKAASNATIGAAHEFGTGKLPQRSFLRVPIAQNLSSYLTKYNAFDKDNLKKVIDEGKLNSWMAQVGFVAEQIVADAFNSGGFGEWPPWITPNYQNNTGMLLVDTQQLRNSITSRVIDGE